MKTKHKRLSRGTVVPLSRDWAGLKWRPVLKAHVQVWKQLQDKPSEEMQNSYR